MKNAGPGRAASVAFVLGITTLASAAQTVTIPPNAPGNGWSDIILFVARIAVVVSLLTVSACSIGLMVNRWTG